MHRRAFSLPSGAELVAPIERTGVYTTTREELVRADAKATTLLSVVGLLLALVGGAIAGDWTPRDLALVPEVMFWTAIVAAVIGEARLLLGVLPRVEHDQAYAQPRYFGHVAQMQDRAELAHFLHPGDSELEQATDQIWWLSRIVNTKYTHVRRGLQFFTVGVFLAMLALLLEGVAA